ncbi:DUF2637 domain-containing protein [Micromonospora sp. WMMA1363]|uniref:DUF2637 domain-containing protein n=1 Tax=Micromonospora sp. WMMA1363 TaxID=3053985 RepID=UPI00259D0953|nr:DUF2637 domain-containing protein [Micromonospora sp. WMMA1363]MDM4722730.1 DUF2637 domain-containing protein [Micromonospora sp. WMMA1363]
MTAPTPPRKGWETYVPVAIALLLIAGVWLAGAVWSFEEQTHYAKANGFTTPELLPLVLDGMAVAMAAVSWAASLDARPAMFARAMTAVAIAGSSASNGAWAWTRSDGDEQTIVLAAAVPVLAMLAFEVLLSEVRRQVMRRRGQPGPVVVPPPRLIRVTLAPWSTLRSWRQLVLDATDPRKAFATRPVDAPAPQRGAAVPPCPVTHPVDATQPAQPALTRIVTQADALPRRTREVLMRRPVSAPPADRDAAMTQALDAVLTQGVSIRGAARDADVPEATLRRAVKERREVTQTNGHQFEVAGKTMEGL